MPCNCLQGVQNNGTFFLYAYVVRSGKPLDRKAADFDPDSVAVKQHGELHKTQSLTTLHPEHAKLKPQFNPSILTSGQTYNVTANSLLALPLRQQANHT